jgi:hypothetical protein
MSKPLLMGGRPYFCLAIDKTELAGAEAQRRKLKNQSLPNRLKPRDYLFLGCFFSGAENIILRHRVQIDLPYRLSADAGCHIWAFFATFPRFFTPIDHLPFHH